MIDYKNYPTANESLIYSTEPFLTSCIRSAVNMNRIKVTYDDWMDLWRIPVLYLILWAWPISIPTLALINRREAAEAYAKHIAKTLTKRSPQ